MCVTQEMKGKIDLKGADSCLKLAKDNFISNFSLTQETQNEREKLLSSSSKEGEGSERLSSLTISNEKEVRFGKNLGSASSNGGGETIEKGYLTTSSMSKEELENVRILRKREKRKRIRMKKIRKRENDGRREEELDPTKP